MASKKKPLRTRRPTERGMATRARIIEAAADLVYAGGVGGTSLDDVLEASVTSKSQLYHYFADKAALMQEVIILQTERVLGRQEPLLSKLDSMTGLRRWRDAMVEITRASGGSGGCPVGSLASELADHSEQARALLTNSFQTWESYLADGLQAMRDRAELAPSADARDLATAIMTALQGGLLLSKTTRTCRPLELALDMAIEHVVRHLPSA